MVIRITVFFLFSLFSIALFAQAPTIIRDISPDGKLVAEYPADQLTYPGYGVNRGDVPLPTQPDWQATLERQVGGLVWADFDLDGDLDLAVGCYHSQSYPPINDYENQVYENVDGVLSTLPVWSSGDMKSTTDVRWADVNGDGYPDLFAANGDFSLSPSVLYLNSAQGLSTSPSWTAGDNTWSLGAAFGDVDGDGDLDVAVANQGEQVVPTRPIYIFYNTGSGLSAIPGWQSADEMITNAVAWGDPDNSDLLSDAIIDSSGRPVIMLPHLPVFKIDSVKVNDSVINEYCFDPISGWVSIKKYAIPDTNAVVTVFYTYMVKSDLAASKWVNYQSGIYYNQNGTLATLPGWTVGNTESQKGMGWADFDRDGDLDLAIGGSGVPTVLYENVNGILSAQPVWSSNNSYHGCQDLVWSDVNRDGYPDLTTVHFGNGHVRVYLNRQGVLDSTPTWYYDCTSSATAIAWGDVNGDGYPDLAVGTARQPIMLFLNTADTTTAISHPDAGVIRDFRLLPNYPNPFNPVTHIQFSLNRSARLRLIIYDVEGKEVRQLLDKFYPAGNYEVSWDGTDNSGQAVSSGIYFYRLSNGSEMQSRRMTLLR